MQGDAPQNHFYCDTCQVVCGSHKVFMSHIMGKRHSKRQATLSAPKVQGESFCAICNVRATSDHLWRDHVRSSGHYTRIKTRVLEDSRITGPLYSQTKAGIHVSFSPQGSLSLLQGGTQTISLEIHNQSRELHRLRGVCQLSNVTQVGWGGLT